ncbi:hypothetical protein LC1917_0794 [Lacticaseibacillus paracasei NRIC 1917]|nr:hypothetical protein LC1917_0794 [Lacticaseibacillus paracasei NRIC 1917]
MTFIVLKLFMLLIRFPTFSGRLVVCLKTKLRYGVVLLHLSNHHHERADNDKNGCPPQVASGFVWVNEPMYPMMPVAKQGEVEAYKNNDEANEVCLT